MSESFSDGWRNESDDSFEFSPEIQRTKLVTSIIECTIRHQYCCVEFEDSAELFLIGDTSQYMRKAMLNCSDDDIQRAVLSEQWPDVPVYRNGTLCPPQPDAIFFTIQSKLLANADSLNKLLTIFSSYDERDGYEKHLVEQLLSIHPPERKTNKNFRLLLLDLLQAGELPAVPPLVEEHIATGINGPHAVHYREHFGAETLQKAHEARLVRSARSEFTTLTGITPNRIFSFPDLEDAIGGQAATRLYELYLDSLTALTPDETIRNVVVPLASWQDTVKEKAEGTLLRLGFTYEHGEWIRPAPLANDY